MSSESSSKRKRSAIACTVCHDRKVRCNVAINGLPCSNCLQDGTVCRIYGRRPSVGPERAIRPRLTTDDALYPHTPSTVVSSTAAGLQNDAQSGRTPSNGIPTKTEPTPHETTAVTESSDRLASPTTGDAPLVPYHAGASEGLDFLFDICHPNRPFKGDIYIINRQRSRFPEPALVKRLESKALPSTALCQDLIRLYFHYVHPGLPIINATDFLQTYNEDVGKLSKLLLWSVLFAAGSFIGTSSLQESGFSGRKALKEHLYLHAKDLYDAQIETNKTAVIQSALLLGYYYIDLEDLDGSWYWIGVAIHLCHGIGLHRDAKWHRLQRSPYPATQFAVWRRIWWCCFYRETWLGLGLGRPLRIHIDDMDTPIPTIGDIIDELETLSPELRHMYMPNEMPTLSALWIVFLRMTERLESVISMNYRARRPIITLGMLEQHDTEIWQLYQQVHEIQNHQQPSRLQMLHTHLLKTYYNSIVIALFRPYILSTPPHMPQTDQDRLKALATDRCRLSASNTTYSLNELVSSDLIDVCPTMLVTSMMATMQIHFYEHYHLEGLSRQHALHNLKLHIMVLDHLRKTYWTADMQHKLFSEALKAMECPPPNKCATVAARAPSKEAEQATTSTSTAASATHPEHLQHLHQQQQQRHDNLPTAAATAVDGTGNNTHVNDYDPLTDPHALAVAVADTTGTVGSSDAALDDFFVTFNPFNTSLNSFNDWVLGNGSMP